MSFFIPLLFCLAADDGKFAQKLPVDKDGYIDYEAVLNERLSKGITPEKNANVLLWKAFGPPSEELRIPALYFKQLGIEEPPKQGDYFIDFDTYLRERLKFDRDQAFEMSHIMSPAKQKPWTAKDYQHLAAWLKLNEKPLAVVIEASRRPDYFNPLISRQKGRQPGSLNGPLLPCVVKCREVANALTVRAVYRVGEGKFDEAWADLLAMHRLARLIMSGPTLSDNLVGIAIDFMVSYCEIAYLDSAKLNTKAIRECLRDLQALPSMPSMADKIDFAERYVYLDALQHLQRGDIEKLEAWVDLPPKKWTLAELKALAMVDWEPAVQAGNNWYDKIASATRLKTRPERQMVFDTIEAALNPKKQDLNNRDRIARLLSNPDKIAAKSIGNILVSRWGFVFPLFQDRQDRSEQLQRNLHIAFALAAYYHDESRDPPKIAGFAAKHYPAKLDELVPKYLPSIPNDIFSDKPLIYRPTEKGFLLYSVGINGKDDGGRWMDDDPPGDDLRVRLPLPEPKKN